MVRLRIDEEKFGVHSKDLPEAIDAALWDFVARAVKNPDDADLEWSEKDDFRATQFTSGWVLYWSVIWPSAGFWDPPPPREPEAVKLWDVLPISPALAEKLK